MLDDDITQRVINVIAKSQHVAPESISADNTFEELKIDSLDGITVLFELEGEFNVDIPDDQARSIKSVRDVIDGIQSLLALKSTPVSPKPA